MKRVFAPLFILSLGLRLLYFPPVLGPKSGDKASNPDSTVQSKQHPHVPVFRNANEFVLTPCLERYQPEPGFNRMNRDIDLQAATIGVGAHRRHGWEFQFDGSLLRAQGYRTLPSGAPDPEIASHAQGVGMGPLVRWNFLQFSRFRSFVEGAADFVLFDRPWPTYGMAALS